MMQYIGNKQSLVPAIHGIMKKHNIEGNTIVDLFAGTHSVGCYFKENGFSVIANDWQKYSYVFGKALIENNTYPTFNNLINNIRLDKYNTSLIPKDNYEMVLDYLNKLKGKKGFFYHNYCPGGTKEQEFERLYFTDENGLKFDHIREEIEEWKKLDYLTEHEYYILLATLIRAMDSVSNTTSVYGAFLKKFKQSSLKPLHLKPLYLPLNNSNHKAFCGDANEVAKKIEADIVYLDPPYNARQYASNYHVLETMATYDNPTLKGKTGLRNYDNQKSPYSSKAKAREALKELIHNIQSKYIILSYNDEGILSDSDIQEILSIKGEVIKEEITYRRYKSDKNRDNRQYKDTNTVQELVYIVKVM